MLADEVPAERGSVEYDLRYIETDSREYAEAREVRYQCLYAEWGLPRSLVEDTDGRTYDHLVAIAAGHVIGYARIRLEDGDSKILQVSVVDSHTRQGVAKALMAELTDRARSAGRDLVYLDAREHVIGFYEKLGFVGDGELFISPRTNTPHLRMTRSLGEM